MTDFGTPAGTVVLSDAFGTTTGTADETTTTGTPSTTSSTTPSTRTTETVETTDTTTTGDSLKTNRGSDSWLFAGAGVLALAAAGFLVVRRR